VKMGVERNLTPGISSTGVLKEVVGNDKKQEQGKTGRSGASFCK